MTVNSALQPSDLHGPVTVLPWILRPSILLNDSAMYPPTTTYWMTWPSCYTKTCTSIHQRHELLLISPNLSSNLWAIVYLLHLIWFWPAPTFSESTCPQAVEQPPRTDLSYPSHHPSRVDSRQGAEYTNDGANVHTPLSALARLFVFLNICRKIPQAHKFTVVAFTRKYSGYRIFHREQRYFL
jgi:hypothetical protein